MKKYLLFALLGGAFITLLASNNTFAESYNIVSKPITAQFKVGCNHVSSKKGYFVIGNRGSLFSAAPDLGIKNGCGYYLDSYGAEQQENYDRTYGGSRTWNNGSLLSSGAGMTIFSNLVNNLNTSLRIPDITKLQLHTSLYELDLSNNNVPYTDIPASGSETYGYTLFFTGYFVPNNGWTNFATPNLMTTIQLAWAGANNTYTNFTVAEKSKFINDVYNHTYSDAGDPKDYLPESYYENLKSKLGIVSDDNWNNFVYIVSYLPSYTTAYSFNKLEYECGDLCQSAYPDSLQFGQSVGFGSSNTNTSGVDDVAKGTKWNGAFINASPNYIAYSQDLWIDSYQKMFSDYITPSDDDAFAVLSGLANKTSSSNTFKTSGWNDIVVSNPAQSWWGNIFNLSAIVFPFHAFFSGFSDNSCVAIPVIGGMLGLGSNQQYCSWWSSGIRTILTPVFSLSAIMLIFGFIMNWLRSSDGGLSSSEKLNGKDLS